MSGLIIVALVLGALAFLPWVASKWLEGRVTPTGLTGMHLLTLLGLALLPIGWLSCVAGGIGAALYPHSALSISCWIGKGGLNFWRLGTETFIVLFVARLIWSGSQVLRATSQLSLDRIAFVKSINITSQMHKKVVVLPTNTLVAFASGIRQPRAVISSGLLALLEPPEQGAVIEHELAHLRLGHPSILFIGATIALAYSWLPPVHNAFNGLRRELEAAADDQVVAICGATPLIQALAKVGLQKANTATVSFADPDTLRYRLHRLHEETTTRTKANVFGTGIVIVLIVLLSWSACVLFTSAPITAGFLGCLVSSSALALYAAHPWSKHQVRRIHISCR